MAKLDLNNTKILEAIRWHERHAEMFDMPYKAYQIILNLPKLLLESPVDRPELQEEYQNIIIRAKFIALPLLKEADILEIIQNNFTLIFEMSSFDLWEKVKTKLISVPLFEERDSLKKKIQEALSSSEQILTKETLFLDNKPSKGTIKNWLTDCRRILGTSKIEALKLSQYLISSPNTKNLSQESREKLDFLLKFYEKLKFSSLELEGIEETVIFHVDGELDVYEEGRVERIGRREKDFIKHLEETIKALELQEEIKKIYLGNDEEVKKIKEAGIQILKKTSGDFKKLSKKLFQIINSPVPGKAPDKIYTVAILKILAEQGKLENLLEEKEFNEIMTAYFQEKNKSIEIEGFRINPKAPQYVYVFLKHILMDKVGLSENESARFGAQLFNILAKIHGDEKYKGLAYFDLDVRKFRWA